MSKNDKTPEPMDASAPEARSGTPATNNQRVCYALTTLVAEVQALFPETPVEYSDYDGRNTALTGVFDLTTLDGEDRATLGSLIGLLGDSAHNQDPRLADIVVEPDSILVSMRSGSRTQDSRATFGLADALSILAGDDEDENDFDFVINETGFVEGFEGGSATVTSSDIEDGGGA